MISVVTPACNEQDNLPVLHERLCHVLDGMQADWEWIVVDDHSSDATYEVLSRLAAGDTRLRVARFSRNFGSHTAIACGLGRARGACAVVLVTQVGSKCLLVRLSHSTSARLRYKLCGRILNAPLSGLESVGPHRLIASLGSDVNAITGALMGLPVACANAAVLICGIGYLASLSLPLAGCVVLLAGFIGRAVAPKAIGRPYVKER